MGNVDFSEVNLFTTKDGRKVTYDSLLSDIYENSEDTRATMHTLVEQMTSLISSPADAVVLMEHITQLLETRVKNDDLLVKIASIISRIIQRGMDSKESGDGDWITDEEKRQLLQEVEVRIDKSGASKKSEV